MTASIFDVISKVCVTMCISNWWNWTYPPARSNPFALTNWATKHNDAYVTINKGQLSPPKMLEMHELLRQYSTVYFWTTSTKVIRTLRILTLPDLPKPVAFYFNAERSKKITNQQQVSLTYCLNGRLFRRWHTVFCSCLR